MSELQDPHPPRRSPGPDGGADSAPPGAPDGRTPPATVPAATVSSSAPSSTAREAPTATAPAHSPTSASGRIAKEQRARRREAIRSDAAAVRRELFTVGMWATRAPVWMWPALILITVLGGALRLFRLDFPHRLIFDETYYVKDGYSVFAYGYERSWPEDADDSFNAGDPGVIESTPEYVVHPPLGKWVIGAGIHLFGADDSFGWRFSVAILGTATIFLIGLIAWKLFRSAFFATVAAGLLAIDGEHFVHSRTSLLDIVLMAFVLLAFAFIVLDREQVTKRLGAWTSSLQDPVDDPDRHPATAEANATPEATAVDRRRSRDALDFGPRLGVRWWLIAAGISLGLAMGVKWSGLYALAAFGILVVTWDVHSRHRAGVAHPWLGALIRDSVPSFLRLVPVAVLTYIATWTGWIRSEGAWDRQWAAENPGWWQALPSWLDWLPGLAHYHYTAYSFHVDLDSEHPYMSNPWGWIVQWRPTSFYYESLSQGDLGCEALKCSSAITSVGNPVIWGLAPVAILVVLAAWILRRDVRGGVILAGLAATWLPWFAYQDRTIFTFYTIVMVPFVVLALTYCLALLWGRAPAGLPRGRRVPSPLLLRRLGVGAVLAAAIMAFAFFWPVYTGEVIPFEAWNMRMWNVTWR
ncbi:dolichyl-phosphate-mannose-protein mannosyltransferase [Brevibacterium sanguinis]|uniref:Polyprenol-phosphate-mannose--protein mannosyltransferase n=2 Tax=Brevibacterium TaxID=1696 RepID=A0A366IPA0_9MICO|nr:MULTISPECIES: phospholipid carrier-dependent glycosyltransferase [Brevibacterium]RBP68231.1 dolichyl-phosphate-mannose-protein mannosyltransferase [Brevibacterium sanguinis]RBP74352.1 dolichyl-phosphate-mannose-protein mannosyltransferase [Brevibacterium celere]